MKNVSIGIAIVAFIALLWWISFSMKRKFNFNLFYKSEVEKMIAPLEHRIRILEEAVKDGVK